MTKRVLRFTASWWHPCKALCRTLESVNTNVPVEVVDIDVHPEVATDYGIRGVPTLVMLESNVEMKRISGMVAQKDLEKWLND